MPHDCTHCGKTAHGWAIYNMGDTFCSTSCLNEKYNLAESAVLFD